MKKCPYCQGDVEDDATMCKHCGRGRVAAVRAGTVAAAVSEEPAATAVAGVQRVSVIDIDMPFGSMVSFMIKWAFAAIPAFIIIGAAFFMIGMVLGILFGGLFLPGVRR